MTSIEFLAFLVGILTLIKIIVLLVKPKSWMNFSKKLTKNAVLFSAVSLIIVVISGYIVLQEMDIVQVGAVMLFVASLMALTGAPFLKKITSMQEDLARGDFMKKSWLSLIIWGLLALWMLVAVI